MNKQLPAKSAPQTPTKFCGELRFTRTTGKSEVPPAGVSPFKTRRKVYWAIVGNRRPNVVSLVIDNNSSFLARLRPLIFRNRIGQRHPLISSKRVSCPSNKIRANVPSFKRRFLLRKGSPQCKTIKAGHAAAKDRISQPYT